MVLDPPQVRDREAHQPSDAPRGPIDLRTNSRWLRRRYRLFLGAVSSGHGNPFGRHRTWNSHRPARSTHTRTPSQKRMCRALTYSPPGRNPRRWRTARSHDLRSSSSATSNSAVKATGSKSLRRISTIYLLASWELGGRTRNACLRLRHGGSTHKLSCRPSRSFRSLGQHGRDSSHENR